MAPRDFKTADTVVPLFRPGSAGAQDGLAARSDEELMQLAAAGVDAAFAQLVRRHEARLRGFCSRLLGDRGAGDDLAQEVFVELWRARHSYEPRGRLIAYLFVIARTRGANALRAQGRRARLVEAAPRVAAPNEEQLERLLEGERRRRLDEKLGSLSVELREALLLRITAGLSYDEMGAALGVPEATLRSRVFSAVKRLRALLTSGEDA